MDNATCENISGSFNCNCDFGYEFDDETESCVYIDPCLTADCDQACADMKDGTYTCLCIVGYSKAEDETCQD
jgi:hypothetical protein